MIIGAVLIIAAGLLVGLGGPVLLRRLPEPVDTGGETKISYAALARPVFAVITGLLAATGTALAVITQPVAHWACWWVFGGFAVLLAAIDARTTWLPSPVIHAGWLAMLPATVLALVLDPDHRLQIAITIVAGAVIAGVGYFLLWFITRGRGIAFGDVRLMPLVGAVAGTMGWAGIYWSILLGSVVGAVIGVLRLSRRRHGPFPYAPALVAGPYAAAALLALLRLS